MNTSAAPIISDCTPMRMLSAPSEGPTARSSTKSSGAASAPERSSSASSADSAGLSRPVMRNCVPSADWIVARLMIFFSS